MKRLLIFTLFWMCSASLFAQEKHVKLIVGITLNKFNPEWVKRYQHLLSDGGFKRIIDGGAQLQSDYSYAYSQQGTDVVTLYSGCMPAKHGIVASEWYDAVSQKRVNNSESKQYKIVGTMDRKIGHAPDKLRTLTLSDVMRQNDSYSHTYSVAMNAETAVLSGGCAAEGAFWFDEKEGEWVSSSYYYTEQLPQWLVSLNGRLEVDYMLRRGWMPLEQESALSSKSKNNNKIQNEADLFFYDLQKMSAQNNSYRVIKATPYANTIVTDLSMKVIDASSLGRDNDTDFLAIGYSALDYMNAEYDINSSEFKDMMVRLDKDLKRLLDYIDVKVGKENYTVLMTYAEARDYLPSEYKQMNLSADVFSVYKSVALMKSYMNLLYGSGDWIKTYDAGQIYLNHRLIEDKKMSLNALQEQISQFMIQFEGVYKVLTANDLMHNSFSDEIGRKMQNMYSQRRSGDVLFYVLPTWSMEHRNQEDNYLIYSQHTRVPLYIYGIGAQQIKTNDCQMVDVLPSLCNLLHITSPSSVEGRSFLEN